MKQATPKPKPKTAKPVKRAGAKHGQPAGPAGQTGQTGQTGHAAHAAQHPGHTPHQQQKPKETAAERKLRHRAAVKAATTRAANVAKARRQRRRGLPPIGAVACCTAEAVAASLRAAGGHCGDADTLALYRLVSGDPDGWVPIVAVLEAAAACGLAGARLAWYGPAGPGDGVILGLDSPHAVCDDGARWWSWGVPVPVAGRVEEAWAVAWELPSR